MLFHVKNILLNRISSENSDKRGFFFIWDVVLLLRNGANRIDAKVPSDKLHKFDDTRGLVSFKKIKSGVAFEIIRNRELESLNRVSEINLFFNQWNLSYFVCHEKQIQRTIVRVNNAQVNKVILAYLKQQREHWNNTNGQIERVIVSFPQYNFIGEKQENIADEL